MAGVVGSVVQAAIGLAIDRLLLPHRHDNNIAPRLSTRLFQRTGRTPRKRRDWPLGAAFHLGYGAGWGMLLAVASDRLHVSAPVLAPPTAALIYGSAFSRLGVGTLTGAEDHPRRRNRGKQRSLVAVSTIFPLATAAVLYAWDRVAGQRSSANRLPA